MAVAIAERTATRMEPTRVQEQGRCLHGTFWVVETATRRVVRGVCRACQEMANERALEPRRTAT